MVQNIHTNIEIVSYPFRLVMRMVCELCYFEYFLFFFRLSYELHSCVEFSTHYQEIIRLS